MICIQVKLVKIIKLIQPFKVSGNGPVDTKQMEEACIQSSFLKLCMNCRSVWYLNQDLCHLSHFPTLASWKLHSRLVSQEHKAPSTLSSQLQCYLPRRGRTSTFLFLLLVYSLFQFLPTVLSACTLKSGLAPPRHLRGPAPGQPP